MSLLIKNSPNTVDKVVAVEDIESINVDSSNKLGVEIQYRVTE